MTVLQIWNGPMTVTKPITGITLDKTNASLTPGQTTDITIAITPADASNKRYTVTSSNDALATVTRKEGDTWTITAAENPEAGGSATITVASVTNPDVHADIAVAVRIPVTGITLDKPNVSGDTKTTVDVTATITPDNATDKTLDVTSKDTRIATVAHKTGTTYTITYVKGGETTIEFASHSDPSIKTSLAVTAIQTGPSDDEKAAWTAARRAEVNAGTYKGKIPSADFEPLEGWQPFADYGKTDPAEIIAAAAKAGDFSALFIGDYYDITVSGQTIRYQIADTDHYYQSGVNNAHHALMVPTTLWKDTVVFNPSSNYNNTYSSSNLHKTWEEGTFYNALPATTKNNIVQIKIPVYDYNGTYSALAVRVFSLSEFELFGEKTYSAESQIAKGTSGKTPNYQVPIFKNDAARVRKYNNTAYYYWERSAYSGYTSPACCVAPAGSANYNGVDNTGVLPCPCFCLG